MRTVILGGAWYHAIRWAARYREDTDILPCNVVNLTSCAVSYITLAEVYWSITDPILGEPRV